MIWSRSQCIQGIFFHISHTTKFRTRATQNTWYTDKALCRLYRFRRFADWRRPDCPIWVIIASVPGLLWLPNREKTTVESSFPKSVRVEQEGRPGLRLTLWQHPGKHLHRFGPKGPDEGGRPATASGSPRPSYTGGACWNASSRSGNVSPRSRNVSSRSENVPPQAEYVSAQNVMPLPDTNRLEA